MTVFVDSRGHELPSMSCLEAFDIVVDIVRRDLEEEGFNDPISAWQTSALTTVEAFGKEQTSWIESLQLDDKRIAVAPHALGEREEMDTTKPSTALRIVLEAAQSAIPAPEQASDDPELAEMIEHAMQACSIFCAMIVEWDGSGRGSEAAGAA